MMKKQNICTTILFFLFLALASCKSHKSVTEQVFAKTDSVATNKVDSVSIERTITIKDSTEIRDSVATEYVIGKFDSVAGARVDTVKQYRYHYERKATDRNKDNSEKNNRQWLPPLRAQAQAQGNRHLPLRHQSPTRQCPNGRGFFSQYSSGV